MHPEVSKARAQVAGLSRAVRNGERPQADLDAAKSRLKAKLAERYVQKVLTEAPPLTDEQRTRLAELLRPARVGGGA